MSDFLENGNAGNDSRPLLFVILRLFFYFVCKKEKKNIFMCFLKRRGSLKRVKSRETTTRKGWEGREKVVASIFLNGIDRLGHARCAYQYRHRRRRWGRRRRRRRPRRKHGAVE